MLDCSRTVIYFFRVEIWTYIFDRSNILVGNVLKFKQIFIERFSVFLLGSLLWFHVLRTVICHFREFVLIGWKVVLIFNICRSGYRQNENTKIIIRTWLHLINIGLLEWRRVEPSEFAQKTIKVSDLVTKVRISNLCNTLTKEIIFVTRYDVIRIVRLKHAVNLSTCWLHTMFPETSCEFLKCKTIH